MIDDILLQVRKPARYLGNEWNVSRKDFSQAFISFALCFPDLYEIGMSNLGVRILYGLLNNIDDLVCERVFTPAVDYEQIIRTQKLKLTSLESKKDLSDFDIIGFSLSYELTYTNVLNMLDLAGIPLRSKERDDNFPLVIAGGPCTLNPEPMSDFIDLFVIGEAEEALIEIIDLYRQLKQDYQRLSKQELLNHLKDIPGVYIPSFYNVTYKDDSTIEKFSTNQNNAPAKIKKRFLKNLDSAFYPTKWLVPFTEIVHDRITLEIMRGCPNNCRFCQARSLYFPYRCKTPEKLTDLAKACYKATGYEEISLIGLSVSDYNKIETLLEGLINTFKQKKVSVSFPSIRAKTLLNYLLSLISEIKKTGLTFAPEASSDRLRSIINKNFDLDTFFKVIQEAFKSGYRKVKLYFMLGLPGEEFSDLAGIVDLSVKVLKLKAGIPGPTIKANVSVSTLIPKPHTAFQWLGMDKLDKIQEKQDYIKSLLVTKSADSKFKRKINISFHNQYMSFVECLLARGDRRVSQVILNAWRNGARLDAWDEHFSYSHWVEACKESEINPEFYVNRRCQKDEILPWEFIDTGVSKQQLFSQFSEAGV